MILDILPVTKTSKRGCGQLFHLIFFVIKRSNLHLTESNAVN